MLIDLIVAATFCCYSIEGKKKLIVQCKYCTKVFFVKYILCQQNHLTAYAEYLYIYQKGQNWQKEITRYAI